MKRRMCSLVIVLMLGLTSMPSALAGGWAVVELTKPLPTIIAGEPITIAFRVLPHGRVEAPLEDMDPVITLTHRESEHVIAIDADATKENPTIYEATFELKPPGEYKWEIYAEPFPATAMPTLRVFTSNEEAKAFETDEEVSGSIVDISILDNSFSASSIEIEPGTTVRWTSESPLPHQVAWSYLHLDDSPILTQQLTYEMTFEEPGTYRYFCGPHPNMIGEIVVTDDATATHVP